MRSFGDGRDWFLKKRYGMFVHWGLYAVNGYHEQEIYRKGLSREVYESLIHQFNPVSFNPDRWIDLMMDAGMEYITLTTKHIDGFCLWDTKETDFNVMNTPYRKDILGMLSEACARRGIPLCLYYSCADMHHPAYPNQGRPYEHAQPEPGDQPDLDVYIAYVRKQMTELCTRYGKISGIFWDANVLKHEDPGINAMIRRLQPDAVINDRGYDPGDYSTPERDFDRERIEKLTMFDKPTEACQSTGMESWGYREEEHYYSSKYLMQCIDHTLALGGNYLLNVGPKADGTIPVESAEILIKIGVWYKAVREAFDGTSTASEMIARHDVAVTKKGNSLYLHFFKDPTGTSVLLASLDVHPSRVTLLNDGRTLSWRRDMGIRQGQQGLESLRIVRLPVDEFLQQVMVVKIACEEGSMI